MSAQDSSEVKDADSSEDEAKAETEEQQKDGTPLSSQISLSERVKTQVKEWILGILGPLLVILRVTVIFIFTLLADACILAIINWAFGDFVNRNLFAAKLLEGIRLLSASGIAVAYFIYLIRALFKDTAETWKEIREDIKRGSRKK